MVKALPSALSVVSWNADHLVTVEFERRDIKMAVLCRLLHAKPDVLCLQEIGSISMAYLEVIRRLQYDIHVSRTTNNIAGVAFLV
jgi:exonuclease III